MCHACSMASANLDFVAADIEETYYPVVGGRRCVG
jgi:hypothetical protein